MPIAAVAAIGAIGSVTGGAIASSGANKAANVQAAASERAAELQKQAADEALAFQKQQYSDQQRQMQPWLQTGTGAVNNLGRLLGITPTAPATPTLTSNANIDPTPQRFDYLPPEFTDPSAMISTADGRQIPLMSLLPSIVQDQPPQTTNTPAAPAYDPNAGVNTSLGASGSLLTPWTEQFQAPTAATEQNDPGFQFRLQEGQKALERSAAARGTLLSGGTAKALQRYGQDYASNEYDKVYGRALGEYQNRYNIFKQNQADTYNKLANMSGMGQTAASQLNAAGANTAGNVGSILMGSANNIGNQMTNSAAARASGYVGSGNAWANAIGQGTNNLSQLLLLRQMQG